MELRSKVYFQTQFVLYRVANTYRALLVGIIIFTFPTVFSITNNKYYKKTMLFRYLSEFVMRR